MRGHRIDLEFATFHRIAIIDYLTKIIKLFLVIKVKFAEL